MRPWLLHTGRQHQLAIFSDDACCFAWPWNSTSCARAYLTERSVIWCSAPPIMRQLILCHWRNDAAPDSVLTLRVDCFALSKKKPNLCNAKFGNFGNNGSRGKIYCRKRHIWNRRPICLFTMKAFMVLRVVAAWLFTLWTLNINHHRLRFMPINVPILGTSCLVPFSLET